MPHGVPDDAKPMATTITGFAGFEKQVEISVGEMTLDGERRLVLLLHDISERMLAQAALARAAEIIEATPDLIVWADLDCRVVYMNEGGKQMLGLTPAHPVEEITIHSLVAGDLGVLEEALDIVKQVGVWRGEVEFKTPGDGRVPVSIVVIADDSSVAVLARDLTERFEIEQLKEAFGANVSHELRTPLTAVIGYLELNRLGVLAGGDLVRQPVEIAQIIQNVIASFDSVRERKALEATVHCAADCIVMGDEGELKTVVSNLVGNAFKFTPKGGRVSVTVRNVGGLVTVEVSDSGIGISDEDLEFVFNRFYRGTHAQRSEVQGAGLGLAIVQGVVQRHGGTVDITSTVGAGTTVTVVLPPGQKGSE